MSNRAVVPAEGAILDQILAATHEIWHEGLSRAAYARYYAAQKATAWGRAHLERLALVDGDDVLASAKVYRFAATLDARPVTVVGLGAIFTQPAHRGRGAARELVDRLLERAAAEGGDLALLFSEIGPDYYARFGFTAIATHDVRLRVSESTRHGAPMTMVRAGDDRDLDDLVAMGKTRAEPYRFRLDRSRELIQYAIVKRRLLAGLGPAGAREVRFFIAEEGASAAAYVVIAVRGGEWSIEECGDRDPTGARVGAILQVLFARDSAERRPEVTAWLPPGFLPPQLTVLDRRPSKDVMMCCSLSSNGAVAATLDEGDLLYWKSDMF
jgi:predicted N-acetyltransferase YhbS